MTKKPKMTRSGVRRGGAPLGVLPGTPFGDHTRASVPAPVEPRADDSRRPPRSRLVVTVTSVGFAMLVVLFTVAPTTPSSRSPTGPRWCWRDSR